MAKSAFGRVQGGILRSYVADVALVAGVAVIAGVAANSVKLPTAANQRALGITAAACAAGDPVDVLIQGEIIAIADAAITRGDYVKINAVTGQLASLTLADGTTYQHVVGIALETAAAQGDEILVYAQPAIVQTA